MSNRTHFLCVRESHVIEGRLLTKSNSRQPENLLVSHYLSCMVFYFGRKTLHIQENKY